MSVTAPAGRDRRSVLGAAVACLGFALAPSRAAAATVAGTLDFVIDLSAEIAAGRFDPQRDSLGLRGAVAPMSWQQPLLARALGDGRYGLQVTVPRAPFGGQPLAYKFRIERPGRGPDDGWEDGPNHRVRLAEGVTRVVRAFNAPPALLPARRTGTIESLGVVASRHVGPRPVQVWLPPGYAEGASRHPVLYLHDGQNVFDDAAAGAEWMVDETADRLVRAGTIEAPIVVAVDSTRDRILDYTPTRMRMPAERTGTGRAELVGGGASAYGRFLAEELKPLVDARWRTRTDAAGTAVGGASLGGLVSLALVLERPEVFGAALVVSPSLWWDDGWALRTVQALPVPAPRLPRLWIDMGDREGPGAMDAARALYEALRTHHPRAADLRFVADAEGSHDELSWASRVEGMLRFLYGRA